MFKHKGPFFIACLIWLCATSCAKDASTSDIKTIHIGAASSLVRVLPKIIELFESTHDVDVVATYSSSGNLTQQLKNGAPYDIIITADPSFIDKLNGMGVLSEYKPSFRISSPVMLWTSDQNFTGFSELQKKKSWKIAIANPDHAPFGKVAMEAFKNSGQLKQIQKQLVFAQNATQVLQYVRSGAVNAAVIPLSLADTSTGSLLRLSDTYCLAPTYGFGISKKSPNAQKSKVFLNLFATKQAAKILRTHGLIPESNVPTT
ncbi:MAG: molybdate ABC transporter substrate-binding protein [Candidatus Lindowbacteria bacterium]|nr:molybdate ABC transporter substrate-binding protein [Candidatus Lindowbacteria bacterium]